MNIDLELYPLDEEENEYATPCYFKFEKIDEALDFIKTVSTYGVNIHVGIKIFKE